MRVPEISLGYGLLAQNKHDLCRYYKYTERHKQTQYLPAYTVSFMVVPSVRAWEFREKSDYDDFYIASKEKAEEQMETAQAVIKSVVEYLEK